MNRSLLVVIVTWNCESVITDCLVSLECQLSSLDCDSLTVLVDNASADSTVSTVRSVAPWVEVVERDDNCGFAVANNSALATYPDADLVLFLNPDTIVQPGAIQKLVDALMEQPTASIAGPCLYNADGSVQWVCARPLPSVWPYVAVLFGGGRSERQRKRLFGYVGEPQREVGAISGAAMLCDGDWVRGVGGFDPEFFFGHEDLLLCWQAHRDQRTVLYVADAAITHLWGGARANAASEFDARRWASAGPYFLKTGRAMSEKLLRLAIAVKSGAVLAVCLPGAMLGLDGCRTRYSVAVALMRYALTGVDHACSR